LAFASPNTQDERNLQQSHGNCSIFFFSKNTNRRDYSIIYSIDYKKEVSCYIYLDIRQAHEVLGDVNNKLVHESRSNVETIHVVVQVVPKAQSPNHVHNQTCPQLQTKWKS
jgi:hypothetical protein